MVVELDGHFGPGHEVVPVLFPAELVGESVEDIASRARSGDNAALQAFLDAGSILAGARFPNPST